MPNKTRDRYPNYRYEHPQIWELPPSNRKVCLICRAWRKPCAVCQRAAAPLDKKGGERRVRSTLPKRFPCAA